MKGVRTHSARVTHDDAMSAHPPGLLVAELLGDHLAQLQSEPLRHFLGEVLVRAAAEQHDIGHGAWHKHKPEREGKKRDREQKGRKREPAE